MLFRSASNQIGDALRGPDRRRESVSLGPLREQARKLRQSSARQFRWETGTQSAVQAGLASSSPPLGPDEHRLAAHAELPGNRRERYPALKAEKGGQSPRLRGASVSSGTYGVVGHEPTVPPKMQLPIYLCRYL